MLCESGMRRTFKGPGDARDRRKAANEVAKLAGAVLVARMNGGRGRAQGKHEIAKRQATVLLRVKVVADRGGRYNGFEKVRDARCDTKVEGG